MAEPIAQPDAVPPTLRDAMRRLAGAVCIITAGQGDERTGFTASSVTSLTLEPPCLLVCINRQASAWPLIRDERRFCVNVLAEHHRELALHFAGARGTKGAERYDFGLWRDGDNGTAVLADALAAVECELEDAIERHSHMVLIGVAQTISIGTERLPLIYSGGQFGRFEPI